MKYFLYIVVMIHIGACAKIGVPTGGPTDEIAPSIIKDASSPNYQTYFTDNELVFEFDEFIDIKSASSQIIISPPLTNYLDYKVKGKKLIVTFPEGEALKENATYQINFGEAIIDFTEGNPVPDFIHVFSTGDKIDSLTVSGNVLNADDGRGLADALVLLYKEDRDSILYTDKPFYFSKTKDGGTFEINNLKEGSYKIYALKDENLSLTYDSPTELVGFIDSLVVLTDSTSQNLKITIFDEREIPSIQKVDQTRENLAAISFTTKPRDLSFQFSDSLRYRSDFKEDTLKIWYTTELDSFDVYLDWEEIKDTVKIKTSGRKKELSKLKCISCRTSKEYFLKDTIELSFNYPLSECIIDSIFQIDSLDNLSLDQQSITDNTLRFVSTLQDSGQYQLKLIPGAVKDFWGRSHDTIVYDFMCKGENLKGNILITLSNFDTNTPYIYTLLDQDKEKIKVVKNLPDSVLHFKNLESGNYVLEVTEDLNANGFWDSGSILRKTFPEHKKQYPLEELRPGWDLETNLEIEREEK